MFEPFDRLLRKAQHRHQSPIREFRPQVETLEIRQTPAILLPSNMELRSLPSVLVDDALPTRNGKALVFQERFNYTLPSHVVLDTPNGSKALGVHTPFADLQSQLPGDPWPRNFLLPAGSLVNVWYVHWDPGLDQSEEFRRLDATAHFIGERVLGVQALGDNLLAADGVVGRPTTQYPPPGAGLEIAGLAEGMYDSLVTTPTSVRFALRAGGHFDSVRVFTVTVNLPPSSISLHNPRTSIPENTATNQRIKMADISFADDGLGTNTFSLFGPDAQSFEIIGNELYLKAGVKLDYETSPSLRVTVAVDDPSVGGFPDASTFFSVAITDVPEPVAIVERVVIDNGLAQRSMVRSLTVHFSQIVTLGTEAFELARVGGSPVALSQSSTVVNGKTVVRLTFSGPGIVAGSLADGSYVLTIRANQVRDGLGQDLDGNGDGVVGGDSRSSFTRLFGDSNGDNIISQLDVSAFLQAFRSRTGDPKFLDYLDSNGDGQIDYLDYYQILQRRS